MNVRSMVVALALAVGALGVATVGNAAGVVELEIGTAPPPPRVEVVPEPREGFIYERGHYEWDGQQYVWVEGKFIERREGHEWRPYVLEPRGEKWHFRAGHWDDD